MKNIVTLIGMELKLFFRENVNLIYVLFLPVFFLLFLGFIFNNPNYTAKTAVIDMDASPPSKQFIDMISTNPYFEVKTVISDSTMQPEQIRNSYDVVFTIRNGFEELIKKKEVTGIEVLITSTDEQKATVDSSMIVSLMAEANLAILSHDSLIFADFTFLHETFNSYVEFLLPGLIVMIIMSMGFFNIGLKLTIYREFNQIKILYVLPIKKYHFLIVQITLSVIIVLMQIVILFTIGKFVFNTRLPGNPVLFIWSLLLSMIMFLAVGFMISSFFRNYIQAMTFINMLYLPLLFLSGIYFSPDMIPGVFKYMLYISPAFYGVSLVRNSYLGFFNLESFLLNNIVLIAISVIAVIVSIKKFKWSI
ncbi:MAG: ABC transporter permease [Spirochaetales bacterium]|nr:ABC transporter permease [Spirochaetales bacterium]